MKYECPECKATLVHKRVSDGFETYKISKMGIVTCIASKENGGDEVYCSKNADHKIPSELGRKIVDLCHDCE